jgi:rod shape-determining protein MreC
MIYLQKHNKKTLWKNKYFKILVVFFLVFLLNVFEIPRNMVAEAMSFVFKPGSFFYEKINLVPKYFLDKNTLIEENKKLKEDLQTVISDRYNLELLKNENRKLKDALGLKPNNSVTALVLSRFPQVLSDTLVINKGSSDFISEGDIVLTEDRIFIGKVEKVYNNRAVVSLSSFPNFVLRGSISRNGDILEIKGLGGGTMKAVVPLSLDIKEGDLIEVNLPYTYAIAVVSVIEENLSAGSKNVLLLSPIDFHSINIVFVSDFLEDSI